MFLLNRKILQLSHTGALLRVYLRVVPICYRFPTTWRRGEGIRDGGLSRLNSQAGIRSQGDHQPCCHLPSVSQHVRDTRQIEGQP